MARPIDDQVIANLSSKVCMDRLLAAARLPIEERSPLWAGADRFGEAAQYFREKHRREVSGIACALDARHRLNYGERRR